MKSHRPRRGSRWVRGAAAVELALVLPVLLLLVLGAIEWGYYFFLENVVVNSAREGARAGSIAPAGTAEAQARAATAAMLTAGALDAGLAHVDVQFPAGSVQVTVTLSPAGSAASV